MGPTSKAGTRNTHGRKFVEKKDDEAEGAKQDSDVLCALNVLYGYIKSIPPNPTHEFYGADGPHPNALAGSSVASGKTH